MRWKNLLGLCALISALHAAPSLAGGLPDSPARPFIARMNGPCPKKCHWIAVQGAIDKTTLETFEAIVARLGPAKLPVFFNSVGGDVGSAVRMGERIRELGLDTAIAATRVDQRDIGILGESTEDAPRANVVVSERAFCASACVFAFAGGVRRYAPLETSLGVHQMTQLEQDVQQKVAVFKRETVSVGGHVVVQAPWLFGSGVVERHLPKASGQRGGLCRCRGPFDEDGRRRSESPGADAQDEAREDGLADAGADRAAALRDGTQARRRAARLKIRPSFSSRRAAGGRESLRRGPAQGSARRRRARRPAHRARADARRDWPPLP